MGTCVGTMGPPPSGVGSWREGFPALSEGRAKDLALHSWKLGQGPGPQRPVPTPGAVPLPGRPCRALMEWAGHWGTQRPPGSRRCCPPCGLASLAPEVGRVAGTHVGYFAHPDSSILHVASLPTREGVQVRVRRPQRASPRARPTGWPCAAPPLRRPSVHVGADRAGDAERLCGDRDVLVVHRAVVVGGDVGVEERHLHGAQADRGARAQAARVEAQQQVQLVLDGLHLGAGRGWRRGLAGAWGRGAAGGGACPGGGATGKAELGRRVERSWEPGVYSHPPPQRNLVVTGWDSPDDQERQVR